MTPELIVLVLAALWQAATIGIAAQVMNRDIGHAWNAGPRDTTPEFGPRTGRLRRAVNNGFEALAFFTIAALVLAQTGQSTALTAACAWVFLAARVAYVPAYAFGLSPWRSAIWALGFLATLIMLLASLF